MVSNRKSNAAFPAMGAMLVLMLMVIAGVAINKKEGKVETPHALVLQAQAETSAEDKASLHAQVVSDVLTRQQRLIEENREKVVSFCAGVSRDYAGDIQRVAAQQTELDYPVPSHFKGGGYAGPPSPVYFDSGALRKTGQSLAGLMAELPACQALTAELTEKGFEWRTGIRPVNEVVYLQISGWEEITAAAKEAARQARCNNAHTTFTAWLNGVMNGSMTGAAAEGENVASLLAEHCGADVAKSLGNAFSSFAGAE